MILLTTPFDSGDFDSDIQYTHIKIVDFTLHSTLKTIYINVCYGHLDGGGIFLAGVKQVIRYAIQDFPNSSPPGTDYTGLVTQAPQTGELIYSAASRVLYEYLLTKGHYAGTIV